MVIKADCFNLVVVETILLIASVPESNLYWAMSVKFLAHGDPDRVWTHTLQLFHWVNV